MGFLFLFFKAHSRAQSLSVRPAWAPYGTHTEVDVKLHMKLHKVPNMDLHVEVPYGAPCIGTSTANNRLFLSFVLVI